MLHPQEVSHLTLATTTTNKLGWWLMRADSGNAKQWWPTAAM